jgi:hypothetical protein
MYESKNVIDITNDAGFEILVSLVKEGSLSLLKEDTDIDLLLQKQAYADPSAFADPSNKMFCIASPIEAYLSARYAEKCASDLSEDVISRINEACDVFNIPVEVAKVATVKVAKEQFEIERGEDEQQVMPEKYAGQTEYGTEFENALTARMMNLPDNAEDYAELAKLASEVPAPVMVNILREVDSQSGADLPWIAPRVGTPEYAVFEKRASAVTVDLGKKHVPFEKVAEIQDTLNDMGIDIDFDANDAYTTKLALEQLPIQVRRAIADLV